MKTNSYKNVAKGTVKKIVKVGKKKTEKIDLKNVDRKVDKENYELKQQVEILSKRIQLTEKVLAEDQWKAFETGQRYKIDKRNNSEITRLAFYLWHYRL